jgi:predicted GH43/DUF377 family glycosyl hydrolase
MMTEAWILGPFIKQDQANPCLAPKPESAFHCPIRDATVYWEEKDVFNPAAVVRKDKVYLLYRAEDTIGRHAGTSRIGLAESSDGRSFTRRPEPVLYPDNDFMKKYEWEGGCEDPRLVEDGQGSYIMTYTAYDGKLARLCIATSTDLLGWQKHGLAFERAYNGKYKNTWSKSGSIVCRQEHGRLIAARIHGSYWMYWGEYNINVAVSDNLIDWMPLEYYPGSSIPVKGQSGQVLFSAFSTRKNRFDSILVEPGPPAVLTDRGILFIYNSKNSQEFGDPALPEGTYAAGQTLFDPQDPRTLIGRTNSYFFHPERDYEMTGQVNNVCFLEGLVYLKDEWLLYYGTADSKIAVASCTGQYL